MSPDHKDWMAARIIHLPGGCRAINGLDPNVEFDPSALNGKIARIVTRAYGAIFADIKSLGLNIFGTDFFSNSLEMKGLTPPSWRSYHAWKDTVWPCEEEISRWSQIGNAAFNRKNGKLWDIASRISHQLRVCSWRLRQISESYSDQLHARVGGGEFQPGSRFEDGFTWLAYLSIQAFLVDACVLRDYMSEFYALFICQDQELLEKRPVTSMGSLKKRVLDKVSSSDIATKSLQAATAEGGWLHELGCYRDLVVHSAPLAKAQGRLFAVSDELRLGDTGSLPAVRLPIPDNPHAISKSRASGEHFEDFERQFELFVKATQGEAASADGLTYAHGALEQLTRLAHQLADQSPVGPEIPHFDETNIIGPIKITLI